MKVPFDDPVSPSGYRGEVLASGAKITAGPGTLYAGDLGRVDSDGSIYVVEREGDIVNMGAFA